MAEKPIQWTAQQHTAITQRCGDILVSASAGTGKTAKDVYADSSARWRAKADMFEKHMFNMFKESFRYLLKLYKNLKLPVGMFTEKQITWLRENYKVGATINNDFFYINEE